MTETFTASIETTDGDEFRSVRLRDRFELHSDEPSWLPEPLAGEDEHPAPMDYLLASLATCQVSVLRQCLAANGVEDFAIDCDARVDGFERADDHPDTMPEHTAGRITHIRVELTLYTTEAHRDDADACLAAYDDGCIVGQSLAGGIDYTPLTALEVVDDPAAALAEG